MDIRKIFPEVEEIKDSELKEKTIKTIEEVIQLGGWKEEDLEDIPFTMLIKGTKISLIKHTRAVTRTAVAIFDTLKEEYGDALSMDRDILISGAILHDVGKFLEYVKEDTIHVGEFGKRIRHPVSGAALAYKNGLPYQVVHIIAAHSKEGDFVKRIPEGWIVHFADFVNFHPFKEE